MLIYFEVQVGSRRRGLGCKKTQGPSTREVCVGSWTSSCRLNFGHVYDLRAWISPLYSEASSSYVP